MTGDIRESVRQGYGAVARAGLSTGQDEIKGIAKAFGYSDEELASIPAESNMGLSCGNPVAMASLRPGETVVDLGCGGGLDVFLAARTIGPDGRAIGIDMTEDMVHLARENAAKVGCDNIEFFHAEIEAMPLEGESVDCVISNCVLNLCPDKDAALLEIYRVLKPGGRLAVSDIALHKPLPDAVAREVAAWTGCIAGALTLDENREKLNAAGFGEVSVTDTGADLNAYRDGGHAACCGPADGRTDMSGGCCSPAPGPSSFCGASEPDPVPAYHETMDALLSTFDVNEFAASVKIFAVKPGPAA